MLIKKKQRTKEQFGNNGLVWDYPMPEDKIGIALQELDGRVPDSGWGRNNICYEVCYAISGTAEVFVGDRKYEVAEGDIFVIKPREKSYIIGHDLKILTVTSPNWYKEQCEILVE